LYPATSDSEKISFNQINRKTGHRIKYAKVDADTGEEVSNDDIMKGYKVDTDTYIEVSKDELENIALESTRTIDIDEFVPKSDIDPRYLSPLIRNARSTSLRRRAGGRRRSINWATNFSHRLASNSESVTVAASNGDGREIL
jgi:hypothetical protein